MAIKKRWSRFTRENVKKVPEEPGVYQIAYPTARGKELWHPGKASWLDDLDELERELFEDFEKRHPSRPKGAPRKPRRHSLFDF